MNDHVEAIVEQWSRERQDLDVTPMLVLGRLSRAAQFVHTRQGENFARHGLDSASFDVLATLRRAGKPYRLTPKEIQRSAMVTSSAIAQRLNRLEHAGLVMRSPNEADHRATDVTLTPTGLAVIEGALPDHVETEHVLLRPLTIAQRQQLSDLLRLLCEPTEGGDPGQQPPRLSV